jgi:hypothetical protein
MEFSAGVAEHLSTATAVMSAVFLDASSQSLAAKLVATWWNSATNGTSSNIRRPQLLVEDTLPSETNVLGQRNRDVVDLIVVPHDVGNFHSPDS